MKGVRNISEGMSDTVGVVILIAVMAAVIGIAGVAFISGINTDRTPVVLINQDMVADGSDIYVVLENEGGDTLIREFTRIYIEGEDVTSDFKTPEGSDWELFASSDELRMLWEESELPQDVGILSYQDPQNPTIIYITGDPFPELSGLPTAEPTSTPGPEDPPEALFSATPLYGGAPLTVNFTDASINSPTSWLWNFGDGFISTEQNPVHNYTTFGTFTVSLIATNDYGNDTETKTDYVTVVPSLSCNNTGLNGYYFNGINFAGTYVSRSDERIVFADNAANTSYLNTATDIPNWPVNIIGSAELFSVMYEGYLVIDKEADYTFYLTSDDGSNLWIDNTDDSDTPVVYNWGLHSAQTNSSTIHLTAGYHPVKVKMFENNGLAVFHLEWESPDFSRRYVESFCRDDSCSHPDVDFVSDVQIGNAPFTVNFTDLSTGAPTLWFWDFGDGTNSTEQNPVHVYQSIGTYTVNLTASNIYGSGIESKTEYIQVLTDLPCQNTGFRAYYYDRMDFSGNLYETTNQIIRFADDNAVNDYGFVSEIPNWPEPIIGKTDLFSVVYEAFLVIDTEDDYTFYLTSDDGARVSLDGSLIMDNFDVHPPEEVNSTVVHLVPGYYPMKVEMYEQYVHAVLQLEWSSPQFSREFIQPFIQDDTCGPVPLAEFFATPLSGISPLSVEFTDQSTDVPNYWFWDFGDGTNSTEQNPVHIYSSVGVYNVSLKASNQNGFDYEYKSDYITVTDFPQPAAWWKFDEASGTTAVDSSGNGNDGVISGTYSRPAGACNSSLEFDGETTYVSVPDDSTLDTSDKVTMCAWIYPELPVNKSGITEEYRDYVSLLDKGNNAAGNYEFFMKKTDTISRFTFEADNGDNLYHLDGVPYEYNRWQHFACVVDTDSGTGEVYINGNSAGTFNLPPSLIPNDEPVYIGMQMISGGYPEWATFNFKGRMDEVMLYTTALSDSQISTIYSKCTPPPVPVADFSADQTIGNVPLNVAFTDLSTGSPNSWLWNFGDGGTSSLESPSHTYTSAGSYNVSLTVMGDGGIDSEQKTEYITVNQALPVADFTADQTTGDFSLDVTFTDLSTGSPNSWLWDFGDGSTSTLESPSHTYSSTGVYTVTLTVTNSAGSDTEQKSDYILITGILPEAGFIGVPTSGAAPLTVAFTDHSTGSVLPFTSYEYLWDFGDGGTSTQQNPFYEYTSPGSYTVKLTVYTYIFGSWLVDESTVEKTDYIDVLIPLIADFSSVELGSSGKVTFADESTGSPTSWLWNFGDGGTSTLQNPPQHSYSKGSTYTATLTVYRDSLSSSISKSISV